MTSPLPAVTDVLPHRDPFLFVDRVYEFEAGESATGEWLVAPDAPFLAGHFPERAIVPGVLLTEALAQVGAYAVLLTRRIDGVDDGRIPLFGGVDGVRFRRPVEPGDLVTLNVTLTRMSARAGKGTAKAWVGEDEACRAELLFVMA